MTRERPSSFPRTRELQDSSFPRKRELQESSFPRTRELHDSSFPRTRESICCRHASCCHRIQRSLTWIPAFAGMTAEHGFPLSRESRLNMDSRFRGNDDPRVHDSLHKRRDGLRISSNPYIVRPACTKRSEERRV